MQSPPPTIATSSDFFPESEPRPLHRTKDPIHILSNLDLHLQDKQPLFCTLWLLTLSLLECLAECTDCLALVLTAKLGKIQRSVGALRHLVLSRHFLSLELALVAVLDLLRWRIYHHLFVRLRCHQ